MSMMCQLKGSTLTALRLAVLYQSMLALLDMLGMLPAVPLPSAEGVKEVCTYWWPVPLTSEAL